MADAPIDPPRAIPAGGRVSGRLRVPSSKSATHRAYNLALLSGRPATIEHPLRAEDTELFVAALARCGVALAWQGDAIRLAPGVPPAFAEIECGNAGTLARFLIATLSALPGRYRVDGSPRLRERPVGPLVAALRGLGAEIRYLGSEGCVPVEIEGGSLRGGRVSLDAGESSQYLSAILMAAQRAREPVTVAVRKLTSAPYVDLTLQTIAHFGGLVARVGDEWTVEPRALGADAVAVEGDYSAACYPAAAALLTGGAVRLAGLRPNSAQGDRRFLDLLASMGAAVAWSADELSVAGVAGAPLRGIDCDLGDMPDQVPTLAAIAPFARGVTRIRNVAHLRLKESDRLHAMAAGLERLGARVDELADGLVIPGVWAEGPAPESVVTVDSHGDHRIAMSFALAGLRRPGVRIATPAVVEKSYPGFWRDLERLLAPDGEPTAAATP